MIISFNNNELDNTNSLFDKEYFEDMDLNEDMEKIYSLVKDKEEYGEYEKEANLSKLRIENHKKYHKIKLDLIEELPNYFYLDVKNIKNIYSKIDEKKILKANYEESEKNKARLLEIEKLWNELKFKVENEFQKLTKENNKDQKLWDYSILKGMNIDEDELKKVLDYYDKLLIITSRISTNIFIDYKNELERKKYIDKIKKIIEDESQKLRDGAKIKELNLLNEKIEKEVIRLNNKLDYLDKLIINDSIYKSDYKKFKTLCDNVINYDKKNLDEARDIYKILCIKNKINIFIDRFEKLFLQEVEKEIKGKDFKKLEIDIEKIKEIVKKIEDNYYDTLSKEDAKYIRNLKRDIQSKIIYVEEEKVNLNNLIKRIWHNYLTSIYSYNPNEDYHFICSNNQFIEPKYETILITKDFINKVDDYGNYQIGFICNDTDNLMYMTNKNDITEAEEDEKKFLKLPNEVESSFIDFSNCNRISLDGNDTVLTSVYFIDDGDKDKLSTALGLANTYNIPLIRLKKDS